jgi:hypothetical protein
MKRRHLALLAAIVGVTLAGCGGDDSGSDTSASRGASGQQGTTAPQIGASGATGAGAGRPKQNGKAKPRSPKRSGGERGGTGPAAPAKPASPKPTSPKPTSPKPPATPTTPSSSLTPKQIKVLKGGMYKQARFLCKASTIQGLAQQYGIKSGNVDELAKAYAAPYPVGLRKPVAAGCKAGLLESK